MLDHQLCRLGRDLDGDGHTGEPEPPAPSTVRVELIGNGGEHRRYVELPVGDDKLHLVARLCLWHAYVCSNIT